MNFAEAYREMQKHPGIRYQVVIQHPRNWIHKGVLAMFQFTGSEIDYARERAKGDRFIGIFDNRIAPHDFMDITSSLAIDYRNRQRKSRKQLSLLSFPNIFVREYPAQNRQI